MEYSKKGSIYYLRVEKGEEVLTSVLNMCQQEKVESVIFTGIGACDDVVISTFLSDKNEFTDYKKEGMLEMVSLTGNVTLDDNRLHQHAHALFSYLNDDGEPTLFGGHLKKAIVRYTGEIVITPVDGVIKRKFDSRAGITVWDL